MVSCRVNQRAFGKNVHLEPANLGTWFVDEVSKRRSSCISGRKNMIGKGVWRRFHARASGWEIGNKMLSPDNLPCRTLQSFVSTRMVTSKANCGSDHPKLSLNGVSLE